MFTPKLQASNRPKSSPFTPASGVGSTSVSRRRSHMFTITPQSQSRRTPRTPSFTPGRNTSRNQSLTTSQQASFLDEPTGSLTSVGHTLELFGANLPISVNEAVCLFDGNINIEVKLDASGWAWLICERKLLVWYYKPTQQSKVLPCRELILPQSSATYTAGLVTVLPHQNDSQTAACIVVSEEGIVRYWPNVSQEGSFVETSADVKGERCTAVVAMQSFQCILATSASTLLVLTPAFKQSSIKCRMVRAPHGMLSGIGRRMSSLIFGSVATQAIGAPMHRLLAGEMIEADTQAFYVLSGNHLQKWAHSGESERLLYQCPTDDLVRECAAQTIWGQSMEQLQSLRSWPVDMQVTKDGVVILAAVMNQEVNNTVNYVLGTLYTEGQDPPQSFLNFTVTNFTTVFQADAEAEVLHYQLLLPDSSSPSAYLYDDHQVVCLSVSSSSQPMDKVEFLTSGDKLLGAGHCQGFALFFSVVYGIVSLRDLSQPAVAETSTAEEASIHGQSTVGDVSIVGNPDQSRIDELSISEDLTSQLKAAFLSSIKRNLDQAQQLVNKLFLLETSIHQELDSPLDIHVAKLSQQMIDDFPASDPRWAESLPHDGTSTSNSVILMQQLEDKLKAHEYYIQFLSDVGIWERLSCTSVRGGVMLTQHLLCEHAEKVVAAKALKTLHAQYAQVIDEAIGKVLETRKATRLPPGLTSQDIFYREISRIEEILVAIQEYEEKELGTDISPRDLVELVGVVNVIFGGMLYGAHQYRDSKTSVYQATQSAMRKADAVPWTSSLGPKGLRALLENQHKLVVGHALSEASDTAQRGNLLQQLLELTDLLLHGYQGQLEALRLCEGDGGQYLEVLQQYEETRQALIEPFLQHQQYERAASLAEKYCDFGILVQLCEVTNNQDRLQRYMKQFQARGFSDFVFKWYVNKGKRGRLMSSSLASHPQLSTFLQGGEHRFMSWMYDITAKDFYQAHTTLLNLAREEHKSAAKKKTLLSLSKLAAFAVEDAPDDVQKNLDDIGVEQDLLLHQEQLPPDVLERLCLDAETMQVLKPRELIQHYVSEYNEQASEFDFKKALDLLPYIDKDDPDQDYEGLVLHIWSRAILQDQPIWGMDHTSDDAVDQCRDTIFFKTLELAFAEGTDLKEVLPSVEHILNCKELRSLRESTAFHYLVKAQYEQIQRVLAAK